MVLDCKALPFIFSITTDEKSIPTIPPVQPACIISNGSNESPHPARSIRASLRFGKLLYGKEDGREDTVVTLRDDDVDEMLSSLLSIEFSGFPAFVVGSVLERSVIAAGLLCAGKTVAPRMVGCNKWQNCE